MKFNYLFPEVYKKIGWGMFVVFAVLNVLWMTDTIGPWFPCKVISIVPSSTFGDSSFVVQNNGWEDEICMVGMILSLLQGFRHRGHRGHAHHLWNDLVHCDAHFSLFNLFPVYREVLLRVAPVQKGGSK